MDSVALFRVILKRRIRSILVILASSAAFGALYAFTEQSVYEATARLIVDDPSVSVSELGQEINESQGDIPDGSSILANQTELLGSERFLQRVVDQVSLNSEIDTTADVTTLRENLSVGVVPATNILSLNFTHPDPELAAMILNQIAETAVEKGIDTIRSEAATVREFLEYEVPRQEYRLRAAEQAESEFRQETGIVNLDAQTSSLVQSLADIENQERMLVMQLQNLTARYEILQDITGIVSIEDAYSAVKAGQDEDLNRIEGQLLELDSELLELQSRLGPQHPDLLAQLEERDAMRALYQQKLSDNGQSALTERLRQAASEEISQDLVSQYIAGDLERNALQNELSSVRAERDRLQERLLQIPRYQQPLAALIREREEAENALSLLSNKFEEARLAEAQLVSNIRIADLAQVPTSPINSPLASLVLAIAAGVITSAGVVFALEMLDDRIHNASELEALFDEIPLLGVLPKGLPCLPDPDSIRLVLQEFQWVEPYRFLLKTLEYQSRPQFNGFVIAGLSPGEGQILLATYLSAVAAQMGRQTLAIEANWYQPVQSLFFGENSTVSLSQILGSSTASETLRVGEHSRTLENLSLLPWGENVGYASSLIETEKARDVLNAARALYDFVTILTSPFSVSSDAATLTSHGMDLVLVVQAGMTSKTLLKKTIDDLGKSGTEVLGFVVTHTPDPKLENYFGSKIFSHNSVKQVSRNQSTSDFDYVSK